MTSMTPHRLYNWGSAILLLCTVFAMFWPISKDTHAASQQAAIKEQAEAFRFARAAQKICGKRAAWVLESKTKAITCLKEVEK